MLRISQEFYHIDRVLESCETIEQLQNVNSWIERILNNWEFLFKGMSDWKYDRKYKDIIVSIVGSLDEKIASMIKMFQEKYEKVLLYYNNHILHALSSTNFQHFSIFNFYITICSIKKKSVITTD